ncbi:MAG: PhoU domain-containing protein, partial [Tissierellaceae bacterium]
NIERSGDRVIEIASLASKKIDGGLPFTDTAIDELKQLESAIMELFDHTIVTLKKKDEKSIERIIELENLVDDLSELFQNNHIDRLNCDVCNVDAGVIYIDIIGHLERIADHVYKIAMYTKDELFGERRKYN